MKHNSQQGPAQILLIENSVHEYNRICAEIDSINESGPTRPLHLLFSGEERAANDQNVSADDVITFIQGAGSSYHLAIVDLGLRIAYPELLHAQLAEARSRTKEEEIVRSLDGLLVIAYVRRVLPTLPIIVFSQYARHTSVKEALEALLAKEGMGTHLLRFLQKSEEAYSLLPSLISEMLLSGGGEAPLKRQFAIKNMVDALLAHLGVGG
jgi:hypothetical protein